MKELEMEEEEEFFDLGTINEYEMLSNEDGSVLIQENCVAIKHIESSVIKMLPLTEEVLQALGLALVMDEESKLELEQKVKTELLQSVEDLERLPSQETLEQMHSQELERLHSHESLGQVHSQESLERIPSEDTFEQEASEQERYQEVLEREAIEQLDFEEAIEQQQFEHSEQPLEEHVDVEAEIDKLAIANATNSEALVWSSSMVNLLLDMYEKYQKDFAAGSHRHRALWKLIHQQMSAVHPELRRCSESHLQGKFGGLKRTYRGALDYLKNNLHTTNWPYFARMDKIMRSKYEMEEKQRIWSESANTSDTIEAKWLQSWTPLLLDAHSALLPTRSLAGHWARVCAAMARVDPRCARLQPARVRRHYRQLQARRETRDPDVAEKLLKIQAAMSEQRGQAGAGGEGAAAEEEGAAAEGEGAAAEGEGAGAEGQGAAAEEEGAEGAGAAQAQASGTDVKADAPWRPDCVAALLEEWASARAARGAGAAAAAVAATLRRRLAAPGRPVDWITGAAVGEQIRKLRHEYLLHSEKDPDSVEWPFFKAARAAFAVAGGAAAAAAAAAAGGWTRAATRRLLQLYAEVAADLDDSGPRFWAELAARLQRGEHGLKVSQRGCEMKMQQLCAQYQAMRSQQQSMRSQHQAMRSQPDRSRDAEPWTYYEQMHRIFSEKAGPSWPNKTVQMLLAIYQREMTRFDCGDDPATVWRDISTAVSAFSHKDKGAPLTPEECRDTMLQLKQKYCKLLRDDEAAKAWPLYKRMSELFSSPLWSKNNVNLLLDVYEEYKERLSSAESASQSAAWREVSAQVNARSASACVSAGHCRAELHVLRARHRAAHAAHAAPRSALTERMNKIFGPEFESVNIKQDRSPTIANGGVEHKEVKAYTWTDASIHHLLELYARHQPEFRSQPRHVVWARIDAGLKLRDPHYSPVKKGSGAWFKYLEIMTKYLDIKEKRSNEKDWPFYERMEAIFSKQKSAALGEAVDEGSEGEGAEGEGAEGEGGEGAEGEGRAGSARRSPVAELETLLCAPRRARKRMIGDTDFAGVFLREAVPEKTPTKQTKVEASPIEEVTALQLLDLYSEHRLLLQAPSTSATLNRSKQKAWQRIARRMQAADPAFDRSGEDCKALVEGMEARYRKMKINRRLVPIAQRLTVKVYQKIESVLEQSNKDTKYTPTKPEMENHHVTTVEEGDILQSLLQEIKRRNDLAEKRNSLLQKQNEQKRLHHAETIDMMSNILQALSNPVGEVNGSDVLNMLEKTMEEIHK